MRSTRPIVVVQGVGRCGGWSLQHGNSPAQKNDVSVRFGNRSNIWWRLMSCFSFHLLVVNHRWPGAMIQSISLQTNPCGREGLEWSSWAAPVLPCQWERGAKTSRSAAPSPEFKPVGTSLVTVVLARLWLPKSRLWLRSFLLCCLLVLLCPLM